MVLEKTLESPLDCKEIQPVHPKGDQSWCLWKNWCWSWNSNTLATSCEKLTHWKRPWRWEGLGAGGEGDDRGWDGWMASPTRWVWVWVDSWSWWWTGRPGVLLFMGLKRVGHDWATELKWLWQGLKHQCSFRISNSRMGGTHKEQSVALSDCIYDLPDSELQFCFLYQSSFSID